MFTDLLFLFFALLLVSMAPISSEELAHVPWTYSPTHAFFFGIVLYSLLLFFIFFLRRFKVKSIVYILLLSFLAAFYFFLGGQRILLLIPFVGGTQTFAILFALILYLGGVFVSQNTSRTSHVLLLIPFVIPFLLFTAIYDLFPSSETFTLTALGITILLIALIMIFIPVLIQKIWLCKPLPNSALKKQLEALCEHANFSHAGLKVWTIMNHSLTAAIIGIVPRFRYVMFTKRVLDEMPPASIEAILAHEIGHSYRKHLLIYPFIFLGMTICLALFSRFLVEPWLGSALEEGNPFLSPFWTSLAPFMLLLAYLAIIFLYFRLVFGFFSRLFERQADLHVFALGVPPQNLIDALNFVGIATGNSHREPNWHHHSIQERIDFLQEASRHPSLVQHHHSKVKMFLVAYAVLLLLGIFVLFYF